MERDSFSFIWRDSYSVNISSLFLKYIRNSGLNIPYCCRPSASNSPCVQCFKVVQQKLAERPASPQRTVNQSLIDSGSTQGATTTGFDPLKNAPLSAHRKDRVPVKLANTHLRRNTNKRRFSFSPFRLERK